MISRRIIPNLFHIYSIEFKANNSSCWYCVLFDGCSSQQQSFLIMIRKTAKFIMADPVPDKTSKQVELRFEVSLNLQV